MTAPTVSDVRQPDASCDLPRDLARPDAFPDPRPCAVDVATTHASWVFLTEHEAWKVKRPVDFGFLDFSDVGKRRQSCEDEVRLGRRLAPDVYAGVVPVYLGPSGASFVGPGRIVDHAVRMRRLADRDGADALLAAGALGGAHLRSLAERLASFYAEAPTTPDEAGPDRVAALVVANAAQTRPFVGGVLDAAVVGRLLDWQRSQLAAHADRLRERAAAGRAREGHGDLRLEHAYFEGGDPARPLVIDPIDFNRSFRCGDVALDVAFLAMELHAARRDELASYFLSCFARASNDYGSYPVLDLFLSYRAWVRAKVACLSAADATAASERRGRKRQEAERLIALADSFSLRREAPSLIAIGGTIGTGKSTLADRLAQLVPAAVVSSDLTRKHLAGIPAHDRGAAAIYTDAFTRATYDEVFRRASDVLASRRSVIVDATFRDARARAAARRLAAASGARFAFVELDADDATLRGRLERRARDGGPSDATAALLARMRAAWQPATELPVDERVQLDARRDPAALARELARRLGA